MRKYLKPAMEMEAFDLRDVITASDLDEELEPIQGPTDNPASSPIIVDFN